MSNGTFFRAAWKLVGCALALVLPACEGGGNFTIPGLGYTTRPNYDTKYKTIYLPTFKNLTFYRGLERDMTKALEREILAKTPYKITSNRDAADTELKGSILSMTKSILNRNQLNEVRESQTLMRVSIIWRDLHTGEILSAQRKPGDLLPPGVSPDTPPVPPLAPLGSVPGMQAAVTSAPALAQQPNLTPMEGAALASPDDDLDDRLPPLPPGFQPAVFTSLGDYIPEIGGSITTAFSQNTTLMATQIVQAMEKPW